MITYGLVKQIGPYAQPYPSTYRKRNKEISPGFSGEPKQGILEPSSFAKREVEDTAGAKNPRFPNIYEQRAALEKNSFLKKFAAEIMMNDRFGRSVAPQTVGLTNEPRTPNLMAPSLTGSDTVMAPSSTGPYTEERGIQFDTTFDERGVQFDTTFDERGVQFDTTFDERGVQADDGSAQIQADLVNQVTNLQNSIQELVAKNLLLTLSTQAEQETAQAEQQRMLQQIERLQNDLERLQNDLGQATYLKQRVKNELNQARESLVKMNNDAREMIDITQQNADQKYEQLGVQATQIIQNQQALATQVIQNLQQDLFQESSKVQQLLTKLTPTTTPIQSPKSPKYSMLEQAQQAMENEYPMEAQQAMAIEYPMAREQDQAEDEPQPEPQPEPKPPKPPKSSKPKNKTKKSVLSHLKETINFLKVNKNKTVTPSIRKREIAELKRSNKIIQKALDKMDTDGGAGRMTMKEIRLRKQLVDQGKRIQLLEKEEKPAQ
jgi:hypothetical protein